jgi:hypothetical protein
MPAPEPSARCWRCPLAGLGAVRISHTHADHFSTLAVTYYALRFVDIHRPLLPVQDPSAGSSGRGHSSTTLGSQVRPRPCSRPMRSGSPGRKGRRSGQAGTQHGRSNAVDNLLATTAHLQNPSEAAVSQPCSALARADAKGALRRPVPRPGRRRRPRPPSASPASWSSPSSNGDERALSG